MEKRNIYIIAAISLVLILSLLYYLVKVKGFSLTKKRTIVTKYYEKQIFYPSLKTDKLYFVGSDQKTIFYFDLQTNNITTFATSSSNIKNVIWSSDRQRLAVKTKDENQDYFRTWVYNNQNKKFQQLSDNILALTWSSDNKKIYYNFFKATEEYDPNMINSLNISEPDGTNWEKLYDFKMEPPKNVIAGPDGVILIATETSGYQKNDILIFDTATRQLTNITNDGFVKDGAWSPGYKYVYYESGENNPKIYFIDFQTKQKQTIELDTALNKFAVNDSGKNVIAAMPGKNGDDFYKINIETGKKTLLYKSTSKDNFDATNLMLSEDGKTLYFTSSDILYKMSIK